MYILISHVGHYSQDTLEDLIGKDVFDVLDSLEKYLVKVSSEDNSLVRESAVYSIQSGGKRFRPLLLFTIYKFLGGQDFNSIIPLAAAIEMVHTATLIHDDIIDGATLRRGKSSIVSKYGLTEAIISGDFLFVKAFELATLYKSDIGRVLAKSCRYVADGELMEEKMRNNLDMSMEEYIKIVEMKTAMPIAAVSKSAVMYLDYPEEVIDSMEKFGIGLGIAFQIKDDILDYFGDEKKLGKRLYTDLRRGNHTIISIIAKNGLNDSEKKKFLEVFKKSNKTEEDMDYLLSNIKSKEIEKKAMDIAKEYVYNAVEQLNVVKNEEFRKTLEEISNKIITRES